MKTINPATGQYINDLQEDTRETLAEKFALIQAAQASWSANSLTYRVAILVKFMQLLDEKVTYLSTILSEETGKPLQQAQNEIRGAISRIKWLTEHAEEYLSNEVMSNSGGVQEVISYDPLGIICNISAWNYPYLVGVNVFVPALIAGNGVIYKPSEFATNTGIAISDLLLSAGVPPDVFQLAVGGSTVGQSLLEMEFDGYYFTGSYKTGQYIYEKVAPKLVPCQLELGGKDPVYITEDIVDIEKVAADTAEGAFYNNGQSCCSVERIYVHEKVYEQYVAAFTQQVNNWKLDLPTEPDVFFGPLTRKDQVSFLEKQLTDALNKGAKLVSEKKELPDSGYYFSPAVLTHVNHEMEVMKEESFGPIIGIMKVNSDKEAIELMQDTPYGLTASVYTAKEAHAKSILREIKTGTAYWNCCDRVVGALPWSGRNHSGIGVTLSHQGLRAFTHPRAWHLKR